MNIVTMAWRNVWRNRRRSLVTIAAMTLALTVEVLYAGMVTGMIAGMEEDVIELGLGDIQVYEPGYLEKPSMYLTIDDYEGVVSRLDEQGFAVSPLLSGGGLAAHEDFSAGVAFQGIDVARDAKVSRVSQYVDRGEWLDPDDPMGVVVGKRLSRTLDLEPGDELVVLTQGADGSMANELYTVRGVLASVASGTDRGTVFIHQQTLRELLVLPQGVHRLVIRRPADLSLEDAEVAVEAIAPDLDVKTWRELMPILGQMLDSVNSMVVIIYLIVYIAVAILILNAVLMAVFERIREFGVLKAIGVGPLQVMAMIVIESMIQAVIAVAVGLTIALPGMWLLSTRGVNVGALGGIDMMGMAFPPIWKGIYTAETIQAPVGLLFFIVAVAVAYPAFKAARIQPVEAMRYQG